MDKSKTTGKSCPCFTSCLLGLLMVLLVLAVLLLQGCGGSGGESDAALPATPGATALLQGQAADGYLIDAVVFLDCNGNKLADPDEPQTVTGGDGRYSLEVPAGQELLCPVVVRAEKHRTRDQEDGLPVVHDYLLETPIGRNGFISPLTTLVKQELDKNAVFSETDAVNRVRTRFGLADGVSFWQDYLAADTAELQQAHATARLLAALQGRLLDQLRENLGGDLQPADYLPATRLISDLQLQHAAAIAITLSGAHPTAAVSTNQQIDQLLSDIDLAGLDRQLLNRYRQLIDKQPATWDATPPTIIARQPAPGTEVPVASDIEIAFSEQLDPATLGSDAVVVSGDGRFHSGTLAYDKNRLLLTLTLDQPLLAYADYQVTVSAAIADPLGNPLGTPQTWPFRTLFQHSPPALPEF